MRNLGRVVLFFLIILTICFVVGCFNNAQDTYTTLIESISNDGIAKNAEADFWPGNYFQRNCARELTCDILGYSLRGKYDRSIIDKYNSYTTNIYVCEDGIEFGIKNNDSKIVFINLMNKEFFDTQPYLEDLKNSEECCRSYASDIAGNFIKDLSDYKLIEDEPITRIKEKEGKSYSITYYLFTFYKDISGYNSSDYISVKVTSKGHLASVIIGDTDAFEGESFTIDENVLHQRIDEKIIQVYNSTDYIVVDHSIVDQKIVKAPDGHFYIISDLDIQLEGNDNKQIDTLLGLISILK